MTDEYVSRSAVLTKGLDVKSIPDDLIGAGIMVWLDSVKNRIWRLPAADVAPVAHGQWLDGAEDFTCGNHNAECSDCHCYISWSGCSEDFNFCPNCGTKMDGGSDNGK